MLRHPNRWLIPGVLIVLALLIVSCSPGAPTYPIKPITLIVPFAAGGAPDATFRTLSEQAEKELGQKIVVVNRTGPGGTVGVAEVIGSKPDGYTIGMCAVAIVTIQPLLQDVPYKGPDDLTPLVQVDEAPTLLYVKADSPYKTLQDLLNEAKKRPGQITVGVAGAPYNILHVDLVLLEKAAGVKFNMVPYGSADHVPAVLGGTVEAGIGQVALLSQHIKAGSARALGVFGTKRAKGMEETPTFKDMGYDVTDIPYEFVIAPKGIAQEIKNKLVAAFTKAVQSQAFQEYANRTGLVVSYSGPEELAKKLKADAERYHKVVEELGWAKKK